MSNNNTGNIDENSFFDFSDDELKEAELREAAEQLSSSSQNVGLVIRSNAELIEKGFEYVGENEDFCFSTYANDEAYALCEQDLYGQKSPEYDSLDCFVCTKDYVETLVKECDREEIEDSDILPLIFMVQSSYANISDYGDNYVGETDRETENVKNYVGSLLEGQNDEKFIREVISTLVHRFGIERVTAYFASNYGYKLVKLFSLDRTTAEEAIDEAIFEMEYDFSYGLDQE